MQKTLRHIILGAGGAIGTPLASELLTQGASVKLVSRSARPMPGADVAKADLTIPKEVQNVVEDSSVVYLLAGLPYRTNVWQEQWPKVMQNTIAACKAKDARLIFLDNVYRYGKVKGPMREDTPVNPSSRKGEVRARIADLLLTEMRNKSMRAIIAVSADFYGPYAEKTSVPYILALDRLVRGKKAQWLVNAKARHSLTYSVDCAKALSLLAITDSAYNQPWHLPTASPPITGEEFIRITAEQLGGDPGYTVLTRPIVRMVGLFNKDVRESYEMLYQSENDYIFDSSKFEKQFNFKPTPYEQGIRHTLDMAVRNSAHEQRGKK